MQVMVPTTKMGIMAMMMMVILIVNDDDDDYRVFWCRCPGRPDDDDDDDNDDDDDDDYRVSWCRCPGRPVRRRTKPLWKGSENVRSDQINEDRR